MTDKAPTVRSAGTEGHLARLAELAARDAADLGPAADAAFEAVRTRMRAGGTLYTCGNGGSAADAQHLATELVVRYIRDRKSLPAVSLTVDSSILTAASNDLGFERVFARQVEGLAREGDVLVAISTSLVSDACDTAFESAVL